MDFAFFTIGINTNLRASDLLAIKADQVRGAKVGDEIELREKKTRKARRLTLNKNVVAAINALLASKEYAPGAGLFSGQRGVWSVPYVSQKVKGWCRVVNMKGNYGSHSLRKTWGTSISQHNSLHNVAICINHKKILNLKYIYKSNP